MHILFKRFFVLILTTVMIVVGFNVSSSYADTGVSIIKEEYIHPEASRTGYDYTSRNYYTGKMMCGPADATNNPLYLDYDGDGFCPSGGTLKDLGITLDGNVVAGYGEWNYNVDSFGLVEGRPGVRELDVNNGIWLEDAYPAGSEAIDKIVQSNDGYLAVPTTDSSDKMGYDQVSGNPRGGYYTNRSGEWRFVPVAVMVHTFDAWVSSNGDAFVVGSDSNRTPGGHASVHLRKAGEENFTRIYAEGGTNDWARVYWVTGDEETGKVYWKAQSTSNTVDGVTRNVDGVTEYDMNTGEMKLIPGTAYYSTFAAEVVDGKLFALDNSGNFYYDYVGYNLQQSIGTTSWVTINDLYKDHNGDLWLYSASNGNLWKFNTTTKKLVEQKDIFPESIAGYNSFAYDARTHTMIFGGQNGKITVYKFSGDPIVEKFEPEMTDSNNRVYSNGSTMKVIGSVPEKMLGDKTEVRFVLSKYFAPTSNLCSIVENRGEYNVVSCVPNSEGIVELTAKNSYGTEKKDLVLENISWELYPDGYDDGVLPYSDGIVAKSSHVLLGNSFNRNISYDIGTRIIASTFRLNNPSGSLEKYVIQMTHLNTDQETIRNVTNRILQKVPTENDCLIEELVPGGYHTCNIYIDPEDYQSLNVSLSIASSYENSWYRSDNVRLNLNLVLNGKLTVNSTSYTGNENIVNNITIDGKKLRNDYQNPNYTEIFVPVDSTVNVDPMISDEYVLDKMYLDGRLLDESSFSTILYSTGVMNIEMIYSDSVDLLPFEKDRTVRINAGL